MKKIYSILAIILLLTGVFFLKPSFAQERLKLATTTSVENSGLLDYILPVFEKKFNMKIDVVAVGTGKALKLGENGDADVLLVHDKDSEEEFIKKGFGLKRYEIMYNDFILVGPANDPAGAKGKSIIASFKKIAGKKAYFVSRGDDSGTDKKEKKLWQKTGIIPNGKWYLEVGQGMGETLQMSSEKKGYCLSDRGTFLAYKGKINLVIICENDPKLLNFYSVIAVNPANKKWIKYPQAQSFIKWITSSDTQKLIGSFKKNGVILFNPCAKP